MPTLPSVRVAAVSCLAVAGWGLSLVAQSAQTPPVVAQAAPQTPAAGRGQPGRGPVQAVVIGPAAPVPPQVAMLRPTPEELAQINAALKKFIATDTSATRT